MTSRSRTLAARYETHHQSRGRYGFSFGEAGRAPVFSEWLAGYPVLLDAGCRDGTMLRHMTDGHSPFGCDIDGEALRRCRAALRVPVVSADLTAGLPFADAVFDAVMLGEVLEHLPDPAVVVQEIRRVLRGGGVFVGSVPNALRLRNRLVFLRGQWFDPDPTHLREFSPGNLVALLQSAGFIEVTLRFRESRFLRLHPRLFGNTMLWRARKPTGTS